MNCSRCGGVDFSKALQTVHRDIFTSRYHIEHARFPPRQGADNTLEKYGETNLILNLLPNSTINYIPPFPTTFPLNKF